MDYEAVVKNDDDDQVAGGVLGSVARLFEFDMALLERDASERSIASQFARHLQPFFPDYHIDVEYNLMGDVPKRVAWNGDPALVYPDLIVHRRRTQVNVLVMEIKKGSNAASKDDDIQKLAAYKIELGYRHALFMRFGVGDEAGTVLECEWVNI
jgi:hypothetical protein